MNNLELKVSDLIKDTSIGIPNGASADYTILDNTINAIALAMIPEVEKISSVKPTLNYVGGHFFSERNSKILSDEKRASIISEHRKIIADIASNYMRPLDVDRTGYVSALVREYVMIKTRQALNSSMSDDAEMLQEMENASIATIDVRHARSTAKRNRDYALTTALEEYGFITKYFGASNIKAMAEMFHTIGLYDSTAEFISRNSDDILKKIFGKDPSNDEQDQMLLAGYYVKTINAIKVGKRGSLIPGTDVGALTIPIIRDELQGTVYDISKASGSSIRARGLDDIENKLH